MSRPKKERNVCLNPSMMRHFAPTNKEDINKNIETVEIFCDELESMKLINIDGMCMKEGGKKM